MNYVNYVCNIIDFSDTYLNRNPDESVDERNIRQFMFCYDYFMKHFAPRNIQLVILSDDPDFKTKAKIDDNVHLATGEDYVTTMTDEFKGLEDKLCRIPYNEDEGE